MKPVFIAILLLLLPGEICGLSQGFGDLNFENAVIVQDKTNPEYPFAFYANDALPGWTISGCYLGTNDILYDNFSLGAPAISILDTNGFSVLGGKYDVLLYGGANASPGASISQTAIVPATAASLSFRALSGIGTLVLSLGGEDLSFFALGTGSNYTLYGANIPAGMAGQLEQLEFAALAGNNNYWTLDDIQFSSSPVPEPGEFTLAALGVALVSFRHWRNSSQ